MGLAGDSSIQQSMINGAKKRKGEEEEENGARILFLLYFSTAAVHIAIVNIHLAIYDIGDKKKKLTRTRIFHFFWFVFFHFFKKENEKIRFILFYFSS